MPFPPVRSRMHHPEVCLLSLSTFNSDHNTLPMDMQRLTHWYYKIILMFKQYVPMKYVVFSFSYNIPCVCSYCYMHILHLELWNVFFLNSVTGECASYPCANGGSCVGGIDSYECKCMPGFTGTQCITGIVIHSNRLLRGQHYKYTMNV